MFSLVGAIAKKQAFGNRSILKLNCYGKKQQQEP